MSKPRSNPEGEQKNPLGDFHELFFCVTFGEEAKLENLLRGGADPNVRNKDGLSPLIWAARQGNHGSIRILMDYKADPATRDQSGRTALHASVLTMKDTNHCLKILLDRGVDPMMSDNEGRTALISAARRGRSGCMKLLIHSKSDVNHRDVSRRTALIWAARNGRKKCVRILLEHKAEIDATDKGGKTALIAAAYHGQAACLHHLQKDGAGLDHIDKMGRSALVGAAAQGHMGCVKRLIDARANANVVDKNGRTALHYALAKGFPDITQLLDENGATLEGKADSSAGEKMSHNAAATNVQDEGKKRNPYALLLACHQGNLAAVRQLLRLRERYPMRFRTKDGKQVTALHLACSQSHAAIVKTLLEASFSPYDTDKAGLTALHVAAKSGSEEIVRLLLGADEKSADMGCDVLSGIESTPLHYAAQCGWTGVVLALLDAKADIHKGNRYGWRAVHYAASYGSPEVLKILLERRADIESRTLLRGPGDTPLICAARHSRVRCAEVLLREGADISKKNGDGSTALVHAAFCGAAACLELLISNGADLDTPDTDKSTALMQAVLCGKFEAARLLVASRAQLDLEDKERNTALIYAAQQGSFTSNSGIITLLVAAGSTISIVNSANRTAYDYGSVQNTKSAIDRGKIEAELSKSRIPRLEMEMEKILQAYGIINPLDRIVVGYWDSFWHYFMNFENQRRYPRLVKM